MQEGYTIYIGKNNNILLQKITFYHQKYTNFTTENGQILLLETQRNKRGDILNIYIYIYRVKQ